MWNWTSAETKKRTTSTPKWGNSKGESDIPIPPINLSINWLERHFIFMPKLIYHPFNSYLIAVHAVKYLTALCTISHLEVINKKSLLKWCSWNPLISKSWNYVTLHQLGCNTSENQEPNTNWFCQTHNSYCKFSYFIQKD